MHLNERSFGFCQLTSKVKNAPPCRRRGRRGGILILSSSSALFGLKSKEGKGSLPPPPKFVHLLCGMELRRRLVHLLQVSLALSIALRFETHLHLCGLCRSVHVHQSIFSGEVAGTGVAELPFCHLFGISASSSMYIFCLWHLPSMQSP